MIDTIFGWSRYGWCWEYDEEQEGDEECLMEEKP